MSTVDLDEHLAAIQAGDPVAFGRWVAAAEPVLRETLRSFATVVDTEAVLQEALLRVWQVAPRFVPDGRANGLFRLSVRITRNLAVSERRRTGREIPDADPEPTVTVRLVPHDPHLRRRIDECHDALPAKPKEALTARLASGGTLPDEVLAERLSMRVNTFLQNITRGRQLLERCLEEHGVDLALEIGASR
jgi:RNA polymerase sigma-70 factor (ECF subfamily)